MISYNRKSTGSAISIVVKQRSEPKDIIIMYMPGDFYNKIAWFTSDVGVFGPYVIFVFFVFFLCKISESWEGAFT